MPINCFRRCSLWPVLLLLAGTGLWGCRPAISEPPPDWPHMLAVFEQRYQRTREAPFFSEAHMGEVMIYLNAAGLPAFRSGHGPFPPGTAVVKVQYEKGAIGRYFLMAKGRDGLWQYALADERKHLMASGTGSQVWSGACAMCHERQGEAVFDGVLSMRNQHE